MITFNAKIQRFAKKGEKTGWSYIEITQRQAEKLNPGVKKIYRIKGKLDDFPFQQAALMPMGNGNFILPINAAMRKGTGKVAGDTVKAEFEVDKREISPPNDFMKCLKDDAKALAHFRSLPKAHQNYFNKWIDSAKTIQTKTKRITMAVIVLGRQQGFKEVMLASRKDSF